MASHSAEGIFMSWKTTGSFAGLYASRDLIQKFIKRVCQENIASCILCDFFSSVHVWRCQAGNRFPAPMLCQGLGGDSNVTRRLWTCALSALTPGGVGVWKHSLATPALTIPAQPQPKQSVANLSSEEWPRYSWICNLAIWFLFRLLDNWL